MLHAIAAPDDTLQLSMALAAADRALDLQPALPEALFNRAIILDALALRGEAAVADVDAAVGAAPEGRADLGFGRGGRGGVEAGGGRRHGVPPARVGRNMQRGRGRHNYLGR
jgi:hypothetical protein